MTIYGSNFSGSMPFSDTCAQFSLAVGVGQTYTIPGANSKKYRAEFSYTENSNIWVGYNMTPVTPPAGTNSTDNNVEFRPKIKDVKGGDVLTFLTPDTTAHVGVSLLSLPG